MEPFVLHKVFLITMDMEFLLMIMLGAMVIALEAAAVQLATSKVRSGPPLREMRRTRMFQ